MSAVISNRAQARKLMVLGLPLMGSNLAHVAIGLTDTVMLGHYSVEALAAQVVSQSLWFTIFIMGSGFAFGVMPLVARHAENGEITELRRVTRMGIWISVLFALIFVPLLISGETILRLLGQREEVLPLAADYLDIFGWAVIPALFVTVLRSYLAALERTPVVLWVTIGSAVLNAFLNWVLIFGNLGAPEMGIRGAAYASLAMNVVSLLALMAYIQITLPEHKLFRRLWGIDWDALGRVWTLGWPISLTNLAEVSLFAGAAVLMGWLGTIPLAAHGIALQLASLAFVLHLGLSNASTVRAGRAFARRDLADLKSVGVMSIVLSLLMAAATTLVMVLFPEALASAFIRPDEVEREAILATAVTLILLAAAFQAFDGLQVIGLGLLRGLEDTTVPMIYAAVAYWGVGVPTAYILAFVLDWGHHGVWTGLVFGLAVAALLLNWRFWRKAPKMLAHGSVPAV